jgi:hypothetical protein
MTKYEKSEMREIQKTMLKQLDKIDSYKNTKERADRLQFLKRLDMILNNYDELTPVLEKYFEEKRKEDKWRDR